MPESLKRITNAEGFLKNLDVWSETIAMQMANAEGIELTDEHWAVIRLARGFYEKYQVSAAMRVLVKQAREQLGSERGNSMYLLKLFPGSTATLVAKIAGLPRPTNCL